MHATPTASERKLEEVCASRPALSAVQLGRELIEIARTVLLHDVERAFGPIVLRPQRNEGRPAPELIRVEISLRLVDTAAYQRLHDALVGV